MQLKFSCKGGEGLGKLEKAKLRLKSEPSDYTFKEAEGLLISLGFEEYNKGKSSGSRVMFVRNNDKILLHKPLKKHSAHRLFLLFPFFHHHYIIFLYGCQYNVDNFGILHNCLTKTAAWGACEPRGCD